MKAFLVYLPMLTLAACELKQGESSSDTAGPAMANLTRQIDSLKRQVVEQGLRLDEQNSRVGWMELQLEWLQDKSVTIDPVTPGYQSIDSSSGRFLIACDDVQPYVDGQKLKLRIGNPNFVTYAGLKLKVKWGIKPPTYPPVRQRNPDAISRWQAASEAWKHSLREKEIDSTAKLNPGLWNTVEIVVAPAKPNEVGYLNVSLTTDEVSLYTDKRR